MGYKVFFAGHQIDIRIRNHGMILALKATCWAEMESQWEPISNWFVTARIHNGKETTLIVVAYMLPQRLVKDTWRTNSMSNWRRYFPILPETSRSSYLVISILTSTLRTAAVMSSWSGPMDVGKGQPMTMSAWPLLSFWLGADQHSQQNENQGHLNLPWQVAIYYDQVICTLVVTVWLISVYICNHVLVLLYAVLLFPLSCSTHGILNVPVDWLIDWLID